jgi:adenylate cyclase
MRGRLSGRLKCKVMPQQTISLAVLFADISGSTHLYETLGDLLARATVARGLSVLTQVIQQQGGTVIKTIGDEVMTTFPSADAAVQAACAMQEALAEEIAAGQRVLAIHAGLHFGPVIQEPSDVFGDAVNIAARMAALAKAGQILTTKQTAEVLAPALRTRTRYIDRTTVKGKQEEIDIFEVIWQADDLTRMEGYQFLRAPSQARLSLRFRDSKIELDQNRPVVTIGRGQENDIVIPEQFASRTHARIEYRRGKFILADQSTNGTFVFTHDGKEIYLHREELLLQGAGRISLGRVLSGDAPEAVYFTYES